ncbi:MAG TPA: hypothetical protein PK867_27135 [Pirellulales bacterium]|nr:hypothetical protein [Pirellulales bacterium]
MPELQSPPTPDFVAMVRGVRELHRLTAAGKADDSPEADAIRDATDAPWQALSEVERQRVRNLSEDLFSLTGPPAAGRPMTDEVRSKLDEFGRARERSDWDAALDLLRRCAAYLAPARLSYLRGVIWQEAGDAETAALFFEHAARLEPDNADNAADARRAPKSWPA